MRKTLPPTIGAVPKPHPYLVSGNNSNPYLLTSQVNLDSVL